MKKTNLYFIGIIGLIFSINFKSEGANQSDKKLVTLKGVELPDKITSAINADIEYPNASDKGESLKKIIDWIKSVDFNFDDYKTLYNFRLSLISASKSGELELVKALLNRKLPKTEKIQEALDDSFRQAAATGNTGIAELLRIHGANINSRGGRHNINALTLAIIKENPNLKAVEYLLNLEGINVNDKDKDGETVLDLLKDGPETKEIIELLEKHGAKRSGKVSPGELPKAPGGPLY